MSTEGSTTPMTIAPNRTSLPALLVAAVWTMGALLPIGVDPIPPTLVSQVSDVVFSLMLASFALVAFVVIRLAPGLAGVRTVAQLLAAAGVVGAIGNFLEDLLAVPGAEYVYGIGLLGSLLAFLAAAFVSALRRRFGPALLLLGTLAGVIVAAGHGPPLIPIIWLVVALWPIASAGRASLRSS